MYADFFFLYAEPAQGDIGNIKNLIIRVCKEQNASTVVLDVELLLSEIWIKNVLH